MAERCDRENEILEALGSGRAADVREHAANCPSCAEVVSVADALIEDRQSLMQSADIPSAGRVWFAATLRARREAERAAMRTARTVQVALVLAGFVIAVAVVGGHAIARGFHALFASAPAALAGVAVPLAAVALWMVLVPVAVYFVVTDE